MVIPPSPLGKCMVFDTDVSVRILVPPNTLPSVGNRFLSEKPHIPPNIRRVTTNMRSSQSDQSPPIGAPGPGAPRPFVAVLDRFLKIWGGVG